MSLWEDSPANQCQSREKEKEQMTTAISGQKCLDSLNRSNPNSLLGRMCKELLTSKTAWYSDRCKTTWKVKVSKSNVSLFQLQASVLGTKGTESGLWLTPSRMDISTRSEESMRKRTEWRKSTGRKTVPPGSLSEQIQYGKPITDTRMYPTPNARDWKDSVNKVPPSVGKTRGHSLGQRIAADQEKRMYPTPTATERSGINPKTGKGAGLSKVVKMMYPTPTVGCEEGGEQSERVERTKSGGFILRKKNKPESTFGAKLSDAMLYLEKKQMHYSPTTNDGKNVTFPISQKNRTSIVGDMIRMNKNKPGGKLNPTFVEFLMGFPMNWTKTEQIELKPLGMQSSHKSQEN